ncbi:hypothetical protein [Tenacibaculum haliotis]|uniref:hypothetical protein n=1 Tax=Tenacibaculum haliotis TaxID=1888914 RepID=UPI0021AF434E|nr:hypothetical protein [Tenacibaculum haliotis]MCT4697619.1 hypothetical protein [Tenacibaculum haliotis]
MIKVRIGAGMDLTLLGLAFSKNQLPKAKGGEVFYDHDEKNEIDCIYFSSSEYYNKLLDFINTNGSDFLNSNATSEWNNLFATLRNYTEINEGNLDFGKLDHYTFTEENFEEREINLTIFESVKDRNSSFYEDMKRLYKGYEVTYWGSPNLVVLKFDFNSEKQFDFNLQPIVELLKAHNKTLDTFNIYRDPRRRLNTIRIGIK